MVSFFAATEFIIFPFRHTRRFLAAGRPGQCGEAGRSGEARCGARVGEAWQPPERASPARRGPPAERSA